MLSKEEVIDVLTKAKYTNVIECRGVYYAVNVLEQNRTFTAKKILEKPVPVYGIQAIDMTCIDMLNVECMKVLKLDFIDYDEAGNIKRIIKLVDYFDSITHEQYDYIDDLYKDMK